jgi:hypothetical protein
MFTCIGGEEHGYEDGYTGEGQEGDRSIEDLTLPMTTENF